MFPHIPRRRWIVASKGGSEKLSKVLLGACILNLIGMVLLMLAYMRMTPVVMMLSLGLGGMLVSAAFLLYLYVVIQDLRRRKAL